LLDDLGMLLSPKHPEVIPKTIVPARYERAFGLIRR
jgi:hypothetical protein